MCKRAIIHKFLKAVALTVSATILITNVSVVTHAEEISSEGAGENIENVGDGENGEPFNIDELAEEMKEVAGETSEIQSDIWALSTPAPYINQELYESRSEMNSSIIDAMSEIKTEANSVYPYPPGQIDSAISAARTDMDLMEQRFSEAYSSIENLLENMEFDSENAQAYFDEAKANFDTKIETYEEAKAGYENALKVLDDLVDKYAPNVANAIAKEEEANAILEVAIEREKEERDAYLDSIKDILPLYETYIENRDKLAEAEEDEFDSAFTDYAESLIESFLFQSTINGKDIHNFEWQIDGYDEDFDADYGEYYDQYDKRYTGTAKYTSDMGTEEDFKIRFWISDLANLMDSYGYINYSGVGTEYIHYDFEVGPDSESYDFGSYDIGLYGREYYYKDERFERYMPVNEPTAKYELDYHFVEIDGEWKYVCTGGEEHNNCYNHYANNYQRYWCPDCNAAQGRGYDDYLRDYHMDGDKLVLDMYDVKYDGGEKILLLDDVFELGENGYDEAKYQESLVSAYEKARMESKCRVADTYAELDVATLTNVFEVLDGEEFEKKYTKKIENSNVYLDEETGEYVWVNSTDLSMCNYPEEKKYLYYPVIPFEGVYDDVLKYMQTLSEENPDYFYQIRGSEFLGDMEAGDYTNRFFVVKIREKIDVDFWNTIYIDDSFTNMWDEMIRLRQKIYEETGYVSESVELIDFLGKRRPAISYYDVAEKNLVYTKEYQPGEYVIGEVKQPGENAYHVPRKDREYFGYDFNEFESQVRCTTSFEDRMNAFIEMLTGIETKMGTLEQSLVKLQQEINSISDNNVTNALNERMKVLEKQYAQALSILQKGEALLNKVEEAAENSSGDVNDVMGEVEEFIEEVAPIVENEMTSETDALAEPAKTSEEGSQPEVIESSTGERVEITEEIKQESQEANLTPFEYVNNIVATVPGMPDALPTAQGGGVVINGVETPTKLNLTKPTEEEAKAAFAVATQLGGKAISSIGFKQNIQFDSLEFTLAVAGLKSSDKLVALQFVNGKWIPVKIKGFKDNFVELELENNGQLLLIALN